MYHSQQPWVDLDGRLHEYRGPDVYADVLERWPSEHAEECDWLEDFSQRTDHYWNAASGEDLCRLYAASRVASTLLLRFQTGRADGTNWPGPNISVEGYQLFFEELGFSSPQVETFHPFYHEILAVEQASDPQEPIAILDQRWPPLLLGNMMFCRAGVVVSGGAEHVVKEIAEKNKLYWTYRRKDRRHEDQSHGWGSKSQWRTDLRRDYRASTGFHFNVDATESLNDVTEIDDHIPRAAMIELVRNRCMLRTAVDDSDLYPYRYSYVEALRR